MTTYGRIHTICLLVSVWDYFACWLDRTNVLSLSMYETIFVCRQCTGRMYDVCLFLPGVSALEVSVMLLFLFLSDWWVHRKNVWLFSVFAQWICRKNVWCWSVCLPVILWWQCCIGRCLMHVSLSNFVCLLEICVLSSLFLFFWPLKGDWGCLMSLLSGISRLSFDSTLLSPLLFFSLVLLVFLSYLLFFLSVGPFFWTFSRKFFQYFSLRDRLFCMAPV